MLAPTSLMASSRYPTSADYNICDRNRPSDSTLALGDALKTCFQDMVDVFTRLDGLQGGPHRTTLIHKVCHR